MGNCFSIERRYLVRCLDAPQWIAMTETPDEIVYASYRPIPYHPDRLEWVDGVLQAGKRRVYHDEHDRLYVEIR